MRSKFDIRVCALIKSFTVSLAFCMIFLVSSCEETFPDSSFEVQKFSPNTAPYFITFEDIRFIATDAEGTSFQWDFGDGRTSKERTPVIAYDAPGNYQITLTVEGETGNRAKSASQITIRERIIRKIDVHFFWGSNSYLSMQEVGWKESEVSDIVVVIGIGPSDIGPYENVGKIDEYVYVSDTIRDVAFPGFDGVGVTLYPKERIPLHLNLIEDYSRYYKLQLYAVDGNQSRLLFTSNGCYFWHFTPEGTFTYGAENTIDITCDYLGSD